MPHVYGLDRTGLDLANQAAALARDVLAPHAAASDRDGRFPEESMRAIASKRLLGLCVDAAHGGLGQGPRAYAAVVEELAFACASTAMITVMHVSAAQAIAASKTLAESEKKGVLRDVASGKHLSTLAFSEKGSRSQFWAPVSTLREAGDGFVASAEKSWVTSASHADSYVASSRRAGGESPLESTLYLVRRGDPGVRTEGSFDGLGLRGNESAPVKFESTPVARGRLLTEPGGGADAMMQIVLPWFVIGSAAMANGLCRAAVAATAGHLTDTTFQHDGSRLRDLPQLRSRLAEMSVRTDQSRALLGFTLGEVESPGPMTPLHVLEARLAALEAADSVTDLGMKACGGAAFSKRLPIERLFRDARAGWVMAPTTEHLRDFVGKALTGLPLFS